MTIYSNTHIPLCCK